MRKISLQNIGSPNKTSVYTKQKCFSVFLGSGVTVYFRNKKAARAYLVKTNKFLTLKLFDLNQLYIEVFAAYRLAWFDITDTAGPIAREFNQIDKFFNRVTTWGRGVNDSSFIFKDMFLIIEGLQNCIAALNDIHKRKNEFTARWHNKTITNRLIIVNNELKQWGKDMPLTDIYN